MNTETAAKPSDTTIWPTSGEAPTLRGPGRLSTDVGKYADLLVLDRDYLTVPEDDIKDLKPVLTMVGGKVVYEAR